MAKNKYDKIVGMYREDDAKVKYVVDYVKDLPTKRVLNDELAYVKGFSVHVDDVFTDADLSSLEEHHETYSTIYDTIYINPKPVLPTSEEESVGVAFATSARVIASYSILIATRPCVAFVEQVGLSNTTTFYFYVEEIYSGDLYVGLIIHVDLAAGWNKIEMTVGDETVVITSPVTEDELPDLYNCGYMFDAEVDELNMEYLYRYMSTTDYNPDPEENGLYLYEDGAWIRNANNILVYQSVNDLPYSLGNGILAYVVGGGSLHVNTVFELDTLYPQLFVNPTPPKLSSVAPDWGNNPFLIPFDNVTIAWSVAILGLVWNRVEDAVIHSQLIAPTAVTGEYWYNNSEHDKKIYIGSASAPSVWIEREDIVINRDAPTTGSLHDLWYNYEENYLYECTNEEGVVQPEGVVLYYGTDHDSPDPIYVYFFEDFAQWQVTKGWVQVVTGENDETTFEAVDYSQLPDILNSTLNCDQSFLDTIAPYTAYYIADNSWGGEEENKLFIYYDKEYKLINDKTNILIDTINDLPYTAQDGQIAYARGLGTTHTKDIFTEADAESTIYDIIYFNPSPSLPTNSSGEVAVAFENSMVVAVTYNVFLTIPSVMIALDMSGLPITMYLYVGSAYTGHLQLGDTQIDVVFVAGWNKAILSDPTGTGNIIADCSAITPLEMISPSGVGTFKMVSFGNSDIKYLGDYISTTDYNYKLMDVFKRTTEYPAIYFNNIQPKISVLAPNFGDLLINMTSFILMNNRTQYDVTWEAADRQFIASYSEATLPEEGDYWYIRSNDMKWQFISGVWSVAGVNITEVTSMFTPATEGALVFNLIDFKLYMWVTDEWVEQPNKVFYAETMPYVEIEVGAVWYQPPLMEIIGRPEAEYERLDSSPDGWIQSHIIIGNSTDNQYEPYNPAIDSYWIDTRYGYDNNYGNARLLQATAKEINTPELIQIAIKNNDILVGAYFYFYSESDIIRFKTLFPNIGVGWNTATLVGEDLSDIRGTSYGNIPLPVVNCLYYGDNSPFTAMQPYLGYYFSTTPYTGLTKSGAFIFDSAWKPAMNSFDKQQINKVFAGAASGANAIPAFRNLVNQDLPEYMKLILVDNTLESPLITDQIVMPEEVASVYGTMAIVVDLGGETPIISLPIDLEGFFQGYSGACLSLDPYDSKILVSSEDNFRGLYMVFYVPKSADVTIGQYYEFLFMCTSLATADCISGDLGGVYNSLTSTKKNLLGAINEMYSRTGGLIVKPTDTYNIKREDGLILCDGTFTATLPVAVDDYMGEQKIIKNVGTGTITLRGQFFDSIDGVSYEESPPSGGVVLGSYDSVTVLLYDTSEWVILNKFINYH